MVDSVITSLTISDFNLANFSGYLENDESPPAVSVILGGFGQVIQVLADFSQPVWKDNPEIAIIWTRPEKVVPSFAALLEHRSVSEEQLLAEVDAFTGAVSSAAERLKAVFVASWTLNGAQCGMGMMDLRKGLGLARALLSMNLRLAGNLDASSNIYLLDAQRWLLHGGRNRSAAKLWYQAKIPFANEVFQAAVIDVKAALRGLRGQARKLIVLDLDDTLWGGVVGEVGWQELRIGGHDPIGEAFQDFQRALKALTRRGIVLGIVSKNTESVALTAMRDNPEMILREGDFVGWRINWQDKAKNIVDLADELSLGLQSIVFIDDSPVERGRVRDALPEVLVPDWPDSPMLYAMALRELRCFDAPVVSLEDGKRTQAYIAERQRASMRSQAASLDDWLQNLQIKVTVESLSPPNLQRATQLLNKTNQFNLSTRRLTEAELDRWARQPDRGFWTFRVADRFGDAGLTGLGSIEKEGDTAHIVDLVLSCRVLGRKIEETLVAWLAAQASELGAAELCARHLPTPRNGLVLEFLQRSGFVCTNGSVFKLRLAEGYPFPHCVEIAH
jgi:FkbH-like protein